MAEIDQLLQHAEAMEASDLHIKSGMTPRMRVIGQLEEATGFGTLAAEDVDWTHIGMMFEVLGGSI